MVVPKQNRLESETTIIKRMQQRIESLERVVHGRVSSTLPRVTDLEFCANAPRVYRTSNQLIATGTNTTVSWSNVDDNTWGSWSAGAPTLLTAPVAGRYIAVANIRWDANATGVRTLEIQRTSDASVLASVQGPPVSGVTTRQGVATPVFYMAAGDSIYSTVAQTSGVSLNIQAIAGDIGPSLSLILIR